jgi:serine/threonine protein kinase
MAPEVVVCAHDDASGYSFPCDIWSAGCVLYAVATRSEASPVTDEGRRDLGQVFEAILNCRVAWDRVPGGADSELASLLRGMLTLRPADRSTAAEALQHPWLQDFAANSSASGGRARRTSPSPAA